MKNPATRDMGLLFGENCTILISTVFSDPPVWQTDWRTNVRVERTDVWAITYSALYIMLSRAKNYALAP